MKAKIYIMPKKGVLDPQGKTVSRSLKNIGYKEVNDVRVGKFIEISIDDKKSEREIKKLVDEMCRRLLVNSIIEDYTFELY